MNKNKNTYNKYIKCEKTKTLMIRKRGLQADIENRLDQYLDAEKKSKS